MATVLFTSNNYSSGSCVFTPSDPNHSQKNLGSITFPYTFDPLQHSLPQDIIEGTFEFTTSGCVFTKTVTRPATSATTQATSATAATTQATSGSGSGSGSGGGSGETQATAATTLATNATTTLEPKTITWNGSTSSPADSGMALLKFVTIDSTSASGQTLVYASGSSGAGAGKLYWSSDATGATQVAEPSWAQVDSVTAFGTGSGVSSPDTSRVVITVDSYPAETTTTTSSGSGSGGGIGIR